MENSDIPTPKPKLIGSADSTKPNEKKCGIFMLPPNLISKLGLGKKTANKDAVSDRKKESKGINTENGNKVLQKPEKEKTEIGKAEASKEGESNNLCLKSTIKESTQSKTNLNNSFIIELNDAENNSNKESTPTFNVDKKILNTVKLNLEECEQTLATDVDDAIGQLSNTTVASVVSSNDTDNSNLNDLSNILSNSAYNMLLSEDSIIIPNVNDSLLTIECSSEKVTNVNSLESIDNHINISSSSCKKTDGNPVTNSIPTINNKETAVVIKSNAEISSPLLKVSVSPSTPQLSNTSLRTSTPLSIKKITERTLAINQKDTVLNGDSSKKKFVVVSTKPNNELKKQPVDANTSRNNNQITITNSSEYNNSQTDTTNINSIANVEHLHKSVTKIPEKVIERKYSFKIVSKNINKDLTSPKKSFTNNELTTTGNLSNINKTSKEIPTKNFKPVETRQTLITDTLKPANDKKAATSIKRELCEDVNLHSKKKFKSDQPVNNVVQGNAISPTTSRHNTVLLPQPFLKEDKTLTNRRDNIQANADGECGPSTSMNKKRKNDVSDDVSPIIVHTRKRPALHGNQSPMKSPSSIVNVTPKKGSYKNPIQITKNIISPKEQIVKNVIFERNSSKITNLDSSLLPVQKINTFTSTDPKIVKLTSNNNFIDNTLDIKIQSNLTSVGSCRTSVKRLEEMDICEKETELLTGALNNENNFNSTTTSDILIEDKFPSNKNKKTKKNKSKLVEVVKEDDNLGGYSDDDDAKLSSFVEVPKKKFKIVEQKLDDAFAKLNTKSKKQTKSNMQRLDDTQIGQDKYHSKKTTNPLPPLERQSNDETIPKKRIGYTPRLYESGTKTSLFNISSDIDNSTNSAVETDNVENIARVGIDVEKPVGKRGRPRKVKVEDAEISNDDIPVLETTINYSTSPRYSTRQRKLPKQLTDFETSKTNDDLKTSPKKGYTSPIKNYEKNVLANDEIAKIYVQGLQDEKSVSAEDDIKYMLCGRCGEKVKANGWTTHVLFHNNLAWTEDGTKLNLKKKNVISPILSKLILKSGVLYCEKCGSPHHDVNRFINHMTKCNFNAEDSTSLKCNVCKRNLCTSSQLDHMNSHNILQAESIAEEKVEDENITCGVCKEIVINSEWNLHSEKHKYLAWKEGETPINTKDRNEVHNFLTVLHKKMKTFRCYRCCRRLKSVAGFISHSEACQLSEEEIVEQSSACDVCKSSYLPWAYQLHKTKCKNDKHDLGAPKDTSKDVISTEVTLSEVTCVVCEAVINFSSWKSHKKKHNNLAWHQGESPIDLNDDKVVESIVKPIYLNNNKRLKCFKCSAVKLSVVGFISHMTICSKSREEILEMRKPCTICGRYMMLSSLKVHMNAHRITEEKNSSNVLENTAEVVVESPNVKSKRAAALNADKLIKNLKQNLDDDSKSRDKDNFNKLHQFYKEPEKQKNVTNSIINVWRKELSKEKKGNEQPSAKCRYTDCKFSSTSLEKMKKHHLSCTMYDNQVYNCTLCNYECEDKTTIEDHIRSAHSRQFSSSMKAEEKKRNKKKTADYIPEAEIDADDNIEYNSNDEDGYSNHKTKDLRSVYCKFKYLHDPRLKNNSSEIYPLGLDWTISFRKQNYSLDPLFKKWFNLPGSLLTPKEQKLYASSQKSIRTANVTLEKMKDKPNAENISWRVYQAYEGACENGVSTMFCGGPVWAMAWAPMSPSNEDQSEYLAVSSHKNWDQEYKTDPSLNSSNSKYNVIQIWNMGSLVNKTGHCTADPKFVMGIAHEAGTIWSMAWCPSGGYFNSEDDKQPGVRIGLLCVACSNGFAYIYSISKPVKETDQKSFYKQKPVAILGLDHNNYDLTKDLPWQATKISWAQEKDHSTIAIGYTDGNVGIYKLSTLSPLLTDKVNGIDFLYPAIFFQAHTGRVTGISISALNSSYLMTGSTDRTYAFWKVDGGSASQPAVLLNRSVDKGRVSSTIWLSHWMTGVVTYDDSYGSIRSKTTLASVRDFGFKQQPILNSESVVWDASTCDWSNGIAQCNEEGEVSLYYGHQMLHGLDCDKYIKDKRLIYSRTEILKINSEKCAKENDTPNENKNVLETSNRKIILKKKNISETAVSNDDEWELPVEDDDEADNILNLIDSPRTYDELASTHGLIFCNFKSNKHKEDQNKVTKNSAIPQYPIGATTRVAYNPNWKSHSFLAVGTKAGIISVTCIANKRTRQIDVKYT